MGRLAAYAATVLAVTLLGAGEAGAAGSTYYVSPSGSDTATGTSPSTAWHSVAKVDATNLSPGDTVLFAGGQSFGGLLQPRGSGTSANPITFGSYGGGSANLTDGIQLQSQAWLVFDGLKVDTGNWRTAGSTRGITTSNHGTGVQNVTIQNSTFGNVELGLQFSNHLDSHLTIADNVIQDTRDSGILIFDPSQPTEVGGSDMTFTGNQILDTGVDPSITWPKHGAYDIGTSITWRGNLISGFEDSGISLRAHGNVIEDNTITGGPYPIDVAPMDPTGATTVIAYNKLLNASIAALEIDALGTVPNPESYVIASNTLTATGTGRGLRIVGTSGSVKVANNIAVTAGGEPWKIDQRPGGGLTESNDLWYTPGGTTIEYLNADFSTPQGYKTASSLGAGDLEANPLLDADGNPAATTPGLDQGTTHVSGSLSYVGDCGGAIYHYCGSAPDLGAVELAEATGAAAAPAVPAAGSSTGGYAPTSITVPRAAKKAKTKTKAKTSVRGTRQIVSAKPMATLVLPRGATANHTFTLRAESRGTKPASVAFTVDGQIRCTKHSGPFVCSLSAPAGLHKITIVATWHNHSHATAHGRLRVS